MGGKVAEKRQSYNANEMKRKTIFLENLPDTHPIKKRKIQRVPPIKNNKNQKSNNQIITKHELEQQTILIDNLHKIIKEQAIINKRLKEKILSRKSTNVEPVCGCDKKKFKETLSKLNMEIFCLKEERDELNEKIEEMDSKNKEKDDETVSPQQQLNESDQNSIPNISYSVHSQNLTIATQTINPVLEDFATQTNNLISQNVSVQTEILLRKETSTQTENHEQLKQDSVESSSSPNIKDVSVSTPNEWSHIEEHNYCSVQTNSRPKIKPTQETQFKLNKHSSAQLVRRNSKLPIKSLNSNVTNVAAI